MSTYEEKLALREQGLTYMQIAEQLGISYQAVAQALAKYNPYHFRRITPAVCVYPNLRRWMNENKIGISELTRRCGFVQNPEQKIRIRYYLSGRYEIRKPIIDKIIEITGMTYEEAFMVDENECK